jgi:hypothetical protein
MHNLLTLNMDNQKVIEPLELSTKIKPCDAVISADLGAEISLLNNNSGVYYTLNAVGASVWRQLQRTTTLAEIKIQLIEEYDVDEVRCQRDLFRIVGEMLANGLIELFPP